MRHLTSLFELSSDEIADLFARTETLKKQFLAGKRVPALPGRVVGLLFEKPSLRTRASFEAAVAHLGGTSLFLAGEEVGFGRRENLADFARVLSQYVDAIVARTFAHQTILDLARNSRCPVINGLSDEAHPCQALADLFTAREVCGDLKGKTLAFVGDGNNVARSLAIGCGKLAMRFVLAAPKAYQLKGAFLGRLRREVPGAQVEQTESAQEAVRDAAIVYTDVWASMGQESEAAARRKAFAAYQVNEALLRVAPAGARFLHCLPAHRGEEVTDAVLDGPQSCVIEQAANRMHVQKALLLWLLSGVKP